MVRARLPRRSIGEGPCRIGPTMSTDFVPQLHALDAVYAPASQEQENQRWKSLQEKFTEVYGRPADFVARAPGRVNLIGEYVPH